MFRPEIRRKKSGTPVLSRKQIDIIGEELVREFNPNALVTPQEIDIDLFAQDYLGMDQDFAYLSHCGVYLGMTVFNDTDKVPVYDPTTNSADYMSAKAHTVIIDKTLLADNQEHRYRFTMGHEASHEFLHKEYFVYDPNQLTIFDFMDESPAPMVQCRVDTKKLDAKQQKTWDDRDWMEWQANALSSSILMPKSMVEMVVEDAKKRCPHSGLFSHYAVEAVSSVFNVSFEAATYRLKQLGILASSVTISGDLLNAVLQQQMAAYIC
jgi:Zn-dependent peptidase ImmA (M78 family)